MNTNSYLRDLDCPIHHISSSTEKLLGRVFTETTTVNGVIRWNSNGSVVPRDLLEAAVVASERLGHDASHIDLAASTTARKADLDALLNEYQANYTGPTAEQRAEARAAFGPGATVVNVVTGHKYTT